MESVALLASKFHRASKPHVRRAKKPVHPRRPCCLHMSLRPPSPNPKGLTQSVVTKLGFRNPQGHQMKGPMWIRKGALLPRAPEFCPCTSGFGMSSSMRQPVYWRIVSFRVELKQAPSSNELFCVCRASCCWKTSPSSQQRLPSSLRQLLDFDVFLEATGGFEEHLLRSRTFRSLVVRVLTRLRLRPKCSSVLFGGWARG